LILKPSQFFFKWYGGWFRKQLRHVTHFFVQDETTLELLKGIGYDNATRCGDTRFDRVAAIAQQAKRFPEIEAFIQGRKCIIAGSSWPPDEKLLIPYIERLPEDYCMIIAPHDIGEKHIQQITGQLSRYQLYSDLHPERRDPVLVLNTIGILSQLYQYARFVYIGGGFGVNIHNIQEPVTFGCPVVFGPKYKSFKEAVDCAFIDRPRHSRRHQCKQRQHYRRYLRQQPLLFLFFFFHSITLLFDGVLCCLIHYTLQIHNCKDVAGKNIKSARLFYERFKIYFFIFCS
jgi:hypothetical protein